MKKFTFIIKVLLLLGLTVGFITPTTEAQESDWLDYEVFMEHLLDMMPEEQLETADLSDLMELWTFYRERPLDLNQVSVEDLLGLGFLSPIIAGRIVAHRNRSGEFISILELQAIEGLDPKSAQLLSQVLTIRPKSTLQTVTYEDLLDQGAHELFVRHGRILPDQLGYRVKDSTRSRYLGSPDRLLLRYRYQYSSSIRVAINLEKDPGEAFFSGGQHLGFDHVSGGVQVRNQGVFDQLIIGDYVLQFGQGLGIWAGYSVGGKGALLHGIARQGAGLKLHSSADEIHFFRGIAASVNLAQMRWMPFVSYRRRDASVSEDAFGKAIFASLGTSGLHRTPNEVANKGQVGQWTYGLNAERESRTWRAGATIYHSLLDAHWEPQPQLRNQFSFSGKELLHASGYYQFNYRNLYVFGEAAISSNAAPALLNGVLMSLHPHLSVGIQHRYYRRDHHAFFAQAAGEGSGSQNEKGLYVGLNYQPNRKVSWVSYADFFRFPWLRYRMDGPSIGLDLFSQFTYAWSRRTQVALRLRYREKEENLDIGMPEFFLAATEKLQTRLSFDSKLGQKWRLRSRIESVWYAKESEDRNYGWMFYQDLFYQPMGARITGNLRVARFNTTGYDGRIYAFENDVLYASSFPVYHNQGWRTYLNLRWKIARKVDFWIRYAVFRYGGDTPVGSGLDLIENTRNRSEIKTQIRIKF